MAKPRDLTPKVPKAPKKSARNRKDRVPALDAVLKEQEAQRLKAEREVMRAQGQDPDEPCPTEPTPPADGGGLPHFLLDAGPEASAFTGNPGKQLDQLILEQVQWVRRTGETPIEFLTRLYRHPYTDPEVRLQAAKALLDFIHKRMPKVELFGGDPMNPIDGRERTVKDKLLSRARGLARTADPAPKPGKA